MPAMYAHLLFGLEAIPSFPKSTQSLINAHPTAYELGQLGPDLFYYSLEHLTPRALRKENIGTKLHHCSFAWIIDHLMRGPDQGCSLSPETQAYYLGYFGHFLLDQATHPIVDDLAPTTPEHLKLEREFDLWLAHQYGEEVSQVPFHRDVDPALGPMLRQAYRHIDEAHPSLNLHLLRLIRAFLYAPTRGRAHLVHTLLSILGGGLNEMVYLPWSSVPQDDPSCETLKLAYDSSLKAYARFLHDFLPWIDGPGSDSGEMDPDFAQLILKDFSGKEG